MIPVLYDHGDIDLATRGKGSLTETTRCVCHEELNGAFSLEFDYPITGKLYNELCAGGTVLAKIPGTTLGALFDVVKVTRTTDGTATFFCEHVSRRLAGTVCYDSSVYANTFNKAWVDSSPKDFDGISFHGNSPSLYETLQIPTPRSALSILIGEENSFASEFGYEFEFWDSRQYDSIRDVYYTRCAATMAQRRGGDYNASLRFGVNILSIEQDVDKTGAYNAVIPFWDDGNGNITYVSGYIVQPTVPITPVVAVPLDLSSFFDSQPTENDMITAATAHLDNGTPWNPSETIHIDFFNGIEVDPTGPVIGLGDTVHVYWGDANIASDVRVVAYDYDVLAELYSAFELGTQQTQFVAVTGETYGGAGLGSSGGYRVYKNVIELGQTTGSATISGCFSAMSLGTSLVCDASEFGSGEVPSSDGIVQITKVDTDLASILFLGKESGEYRMFLNSSGQPSGTWLKSSRYYGSHTVRAVGMGIGSNKISVIIPWSNPQGSTPTVSNVSASIADVGSVTVSVDSSRTNKDAIAFTLSSTSSNHSAYLCRVDFTLS